MGLVMCDWVTGRVRVAPEWVDVHGVWDSGQVRVFGPGGEVLGHFPRRSSAEGSHSSNITFRAGLAGTELELSGNPVKFFQGHNLFGSSDPVALFLSAGHRLRAEGLEFPSPASWRSYSCSLSLSRVDLTRSYRFGSNGAAAAWIAAVGRYSRTRVGSGSFSGDTLYFGKNSTYYSVKIYLKSKEMVARKKGHLLPFSFPDPDRKELLDWGEGVVRFEVTLRSRVLNTLGLDFDPMEQWLKYVGKVDFMGSPAKSRELLERPEVLGLPNPTRLALAAWVYGDSETVRSLSRPTAYRYRAQIRKAVGVDIFGPCPEDSSELSAELDPAGWDPEPIEHLSFKPDAGLRSAYGL